MKVRVAELGGKFQEVDIGADATVEDALKSANVDYSRSKELRINSEKAALEDILEEGDVVQLIPNVEGGR